MNELANMTKLIVAYRNFEANNKEIFKCRIG